MNLDEQLAVPKAENLDVMTAETSVDAMAGQLVELRDVTKERSTVF